jgi:hypothetical protein
LIFDKTKYFIDDRIFSTKFFCNLSQCKGGCCTIRSSYGAPLREEEIEIINGVIEIVKKYLSEKSIDILNGKGFFFKEGEKIYLNNVNDEDCVFSYITDGIAGCSFEKAYKSGEINFKKPISCELFPIRVYGDESNILRFEKMTECDDALEYGKEKNTNVFEFVKEAIERKYGIDFYNNLNNFVKEK